MLAQTWSPGDQLRHEGNPGWNAPPVIFVLLPEELDQVALLGCKVKGQMHSRLLEQNDDSLLSRDEKKYCSEATKTMTQIGLPKRIWHRMETR